ncbi:UDP-4-amino-4,6-dideoxy-N-acetyl-beta-L-altrosamine transaminase [Propionivibrio dicarboxylicus]|uniref:UDP-4-amino-4,6-dideoxy-N-acetyl-beta-L-altrosamine transaminase n=2 Tax=Propionivibrio dicarboxylicus TaxID=83767 RepID=A0A1G8DWD4_9RHOO|nr:UDP-4-amino-4,6-dideoxy-N-acetyl-beta-L-altrosamine transaminase [Propionivibrio dicarboxylicus]
MIPYGRQDITEADIDAVVSVLRSDFLTQGPVVPRFEEKLARKVKVEHAVAVNSATSALHIACLALELGPGDILWTSSITFAASANCALYCGAKVDFVDIDPNTFNISPIKLREKLEVAAKAGRLPKVVVAVHMCGQSCDMRAIHALGQEFGFAIIEDASHAIGGQYLGTPIGDCRFSDITVFSFHPVKIITTAEGGVATTQDARLAERMRLLRSHGISREPSQLTRSSEGPWYYEQLALGFNYRMTEIQAALGVSQLDRLDDYVAIRHRKAQAYSELLAGLPLDTPWLHPDTYSAFHLYVVRLDIDAIGKPLGLLHEQMRAAGIAVNLHYIPVPMQPYYTGMGFDATEWPEACRYYRCAMTLPLFPTMQEVQQIKVAATLRTILEGGNSTQ